VEKFLNREEFTSKDVKRGKLSQRDAENKVPILEQAIKNMAGFEEKIKLSDISEFLSDKGRHECPICKKKRKFLPEKNSLKF